MHFSIFDILIRKFTRRYKIPRVVDELALGHFFR